MHILIKRTSEHINKDFGEFLIPIIQEELILNINSAKLINWNNYINNNVKVFKSIYRKRITAEEIITLGLRNLEVLESPTNIIIQINNKLLIPGYDRLNLSAACKLINFGNTEIRGYPIFTNTFTQIINYISDYYDEYLEG